MIKYVLITILVALAGLFAWWTLSPLFIDVEVHDELPTNTLPPDQNAPEEEKLTGPELESTNDSIARDTALTELPETSTERLYPIAHTPGHSATGNIRVVETPEEKIIRYEDYDGTNGPDLKIYLSKDLDANDFIDLGPSRANKGNVNYSVPLDVDIDAYQYVLTWCEAFGVLFDYAKIN